MAAYDNVSLPASPTPASYAPPIVDMSAIGNLVSNYQQGQQYGRTRAIQTAFQNGFPVNPQTGAPDYGAMANRLLQVGGPEAAQPYFQLAMTQQNSEDFNKIDPGTGPSQAISHPAAAGSANIIGTEPRGAPGANPAPNTLRSVLTAGLGLQDAQRFLDPAMAPMWAKVLGANVGPDDQLSEQQLRAAVARFPQLAQAQGQGQDQQSRPPGGPPFAVNTPGTRNNTGVLGPDENLINQGATNSGAEVSNNGRNNAPPSSRQPASPNDPEIARNQAIIRRASSYLSRPGLSQGQIDGANKTIDTAQQAIKARTDLLNENAKQTGEEKNQGVTPGVGPPAAIRAAQATRGEKMYEAINGEEQAYINENGPAIQTAKRILENPKMYAGFGADTVLDFNKVKAAFGGDPDSAALQEAMSKVTAINTLTQLNAQKLQMGESGGTQAGRIFQAQVELVQKAAQNIGNTIKGNLFLANYQQRMGEWAQRKADMARDYRASHNGVLDDGFDKLVAQNLQQHPIFTPEERAKPLLLSAPDAPPGIKDRAGALQWAKTMGLKSGDAVRLPNGTYTAAP